MLSVDKNDAVGISFITLGVATQLFKYDSISLIILNSMSPNDSSVWFIQTFLP